MDSGSGFASPRANPYGKRYVSDHVVEKSLPNSKLMQVGSRCALQFGMIFGSRSVARKSVSVNRQVNIMFG